MSVGAVLKSGDYPGLIIEPPHQSTDLRLDLRQDLYLQHFVNQPHVNFICSDVKNPHYVVSVLTTPYSTFKYKALTTTKSSSEEWELTVGMDKSAPLEVNIERSLIRDGISGVLITNPDFMKDLELVEKKHPQLRTTMKLALVYCKGFQTKPQDILANGKGNEKLPQNFYRFLDGMSKLKNLSGWTAYRGDMREPGTFYYTQWTQHNIEVVFHVAPFLAQEEIRRLIGNDVGYIIFLEEGYNFTFDPQDVDSFGEVPQVFVVVQPVQDKYRVGFFQKKSILPHGPRPPAQLLDFETTKNYILTKLYNGLVCTNYSPPLNRLYYKPRQETLEEICRKYLNELPRKRVNNPLNDLKPTPRRKISEKNLKLPGEVTFITDATSYHPINALVLLVAANLSYLVGNDLKRDCQYQLGFEPDCIFEISHKVNKAHGFIAFDNQKFFVSFSSFPFDVKKRLAKGKKIKVECNNQQLPGVVFSVFGKSVNVVSDMIIGAISKYWNHQKIYISGYESGGCLATLVAHILDLRGTKVSAVYTFGSPKVGDLEWSQAYPKQLNQNTYRIAHHSDFFPAHPSDRNWFHVGKLHTVGNTVLNEQDPHSMESYFNALLPHHKESIQQLGRNTEDRIQQSADQIRKRISVRESRNAQINPRTSGAVYQEEVMLSRGVRRQPNLTNAAPPPMRALPIHARTLPKMPSSPPPPLPSAAPPPLPSNPPPLHLPPLPSNPQTQPLSSPHEPRKVTQQLNKPTSSNALHQLSPRQLPKAIISNRTPSPVNRNINTNTNTNINTNIINTNSTNTNNINTNTNINTNIINTNSTNTNINTNIINTNSTNTNINTNIINTNSTNTNINTNIINTNSTNTNTNTNISNINTSTNINSNIINTNTNNDMNTNLMNTNIINTNIINTNNKPLLRRRSTGHMQPLVLQNHLNFFKSSLTSLISNFKNIRSIIYNNSPPHQLSHHLYEILQTVKENRFILNEHNDGQPILVKFKEKFGEFLQGVELFCKFCNEIRKNNIIPPPPASLERFDVLFKQLASLAKVINEYCKVLATTST